MNVRQWTGFACTYAKPQSNLPPVVRWKRFLGWGRGVRQQSTLEHTCGLSLFGDDVLHMLEPYVHLDQELVRRALEVHDFGEGELRRDVLYLDKTHQKDADEYAAFKRRWRHLGAASWHRRQEAFLLQFAFENPVEFPDEARAVMRWLIKAHRYDAIAFGAIEHWDYVLYALEQWKERRNPVVLCAVLANCWEKLKLFSRELPGFREVCWTPGFVRWATQFRAQHAKAYGRYLKAKGGKS